MKKSWRVNTLAYRQQVMEQVEQFQKLGYTRAKEARDRVYTLADMIRVLDKVDKIAETADKPPIGYHQKLRKVKMVLNDNKPFLTFLALTSGIRDDE